MKSISKNKRAYHDYEIDKDYDVGIVLQWHEVKSIKQSHVNIKDAFVRIEDKELYLLNMDVPLYEKTAHVLVPGYQPKGKRKLLITKKELTKISALTDKPGNVVIPLEIYVDKNNRIKLKIGVAKLMRKVEKKQVLKDKDIKRDMDREMKHL